jgi:hypothetical protein
VCVCVCARACVRVCVCMYVCLYVCMYVCMYVCTHIHCTDRHGTGTKGGTTVQIRTRLKEQERGARERGREAHPKAGEAQSSKKPPAAVGVGVESVKKLRLPPPATEDRRWTAPAPVTEDRRCAFNCATALAAACASKGRLQVCARIIAAWRHGRTEWLAVYTEWLAVYTLFSTDISRSRVPFAQALRIRWSSPRPHTIMGI